MALLQGFPADYFFLGRLTAKYNQIGDAVPPMISSIIAAHLHSIRVGDVDVDSFIARRDSQHALALRENGEIYASSGSRGA